MSTSKLSGQAGNGQIANQVNSVIRDVQGLKSTQVFKDATGKRRIIFGKLPDGNYGLVISKEGYDVVDVFD